VVSALSFFSTHGEPIADEYDPSRPNDYEDVLRERERKRRDAEEEAERVKRQREAELVGATGPDCSAVAGAGGFEIAVVEAVVGGRHVQVLELSRGGVHLVACTAPGRLHPFAASHKMRVHLALPPIILPCCQFTGGGAAEAGTGRGSCGGPGHVAAVSGARRPCRGRGGAGQAGALWRPGCE
jgi:hypothetical protein